MPKAYLLHREDFLVLRSEVGSFVNIAKRANEAPGVMNTHRFPVSDSANVYLEAFICN